MNMKLNAKRNVIKFLVVSSFTVVLALAYSSGPPTGYTGGFSEPICTGCHGGHEPDDNFGSLDIVGVPDTYTPGECYDLSVVLMRPGQQRWGFELATRFRSDDVFINGTQAGTIYTLKGDPTTQIQTKPITGIQYLMHTTDGTFWGVPDGPVNWDFTWCAPDEALAPVYFNAAGNAANGDGTPGGDYIYTGFGYSREPAK